MSFTTDELVAFSEQLAASPELWRHHTERDGARVYGQIWDDDEVNAWVICWSEDADTGFHDHDESAAAITVVEGRVREDRLRLADTPISRQMAAGTTFTVPPVAIHRVLHGGGGRAVTIHAYSPPLRRTGAYQVGRDGELERESQPFEVELRGEPAAV